MNETLTRRLSDIASNCGADLFGVAEVNDFSRYTDKRNPHFYVDRAKSVIVIGYHINDPMGEVKAAVYTSNSINSPGIPDFVFQSLIDIKYDGTDRAIIYHTY